MQHGRDEILCSSMSEFAVSVLCERALRGAHLRVCCAVRVDVWRCVMWTCGVVFFDRPRAGGVCGLG